MQSVDYANMRRAMVDSQLRTSGVTDTWVLAAMGTLAREDFVPDGLREVAYMDRSIALPDGTVLNPAVATAQMLQAAEITPDDDVLLIGDRNSYAAALLSQRAAKVTVAVSAEGLAKAAYSVIFIDGAVEELPEQLVAAAREGGRIVTGQLDRGVTSLALGIVRSGRVALRHFADSEIAPLAAFARKPEFVF
jgi:protein-L-isoaspartate(D-aspartate) O-methyltransferase